jgi:Tfp pilus assembly protein PilV
MIELLTAMILMFVVMAAIYGVWFGLQRSYSFTEDDMRAQREAQSALAEMVELIRTARQPSNPPSDALNVVIYYADDNSLICWTDSDRDPNHTLELVRFRVDTATRTLYRDTDVNHTNDATFANASAIRLVGNWVSNKESLPLFSYVGADGLPMATYGPTHAVVDPTQIREVRIDLRIDLYENNRPIAHELRSVVQPRNLRQY